MSLTEFNQSDRCVHFTCPERTVSPAVYILLYVCSAAVVLLTVCGNLLVIISVFHFKQLHTPTNMLVLSLAVSDFLSGIFVMPPMFIWTIESCWVFGKDFCSIYWFTNSIFTISIYTIALIAVDRYLALSNPFLYMNIVSVKITCVVMFFGWCFAMGYNIAAIYFNIGNLTSSGMCPSECFISLNEIWTVIDFVYSFIFPLSVIIILYTQVFMIAKKHATAIRELNNHARPKTQKITSHSMKSERKAAKVLGILVFVFIMCLLPYFLYSFLGNVIELQANTFQKVSILFCLNSTINPLIYALCYPWFRKCIQLIVTLQIFQIDSALINVLS
ncbi:trace amine-associated receptor 13c-like [Clarias gariepinus]|uniref:trace amine-associated receptor 13c-like n=1 Tax=Clarias gariepinus TaxID=13013 RepID=UPI00234E07A5|nr:trace amine-associated receptor 13c-like [Clarias gariepinus]